MNFRLAAFLTIVAITSTNAINVIEANNANHGHNVVSQPAQNKKPTHAALKAAAAAKHTNSTKSANSTADDLDFASIAQAEAIIEDLDEIHGLLSSFRTDLKNPAVFSQVLKLNTTELLKTLASVNVTDSQDEVNATFNELLDEFQALASKTNTTADDKAVKLLAKLQASVVGLKGSVAAANSNLRNPTAAALKKLDAPIQAGVDALESAISQDKDSQADIKSNLLPSLKTDVKAVQASIEQVSDQLKTVVAAAKANLKAQNKKATR